MSDTSPPKRYWQVLDRWHWDRKLADNGWTLEQLSTATGIKQGTLNAIRYGYLPRGELRDAIALALGTTKQVLWITITQGD